MPDFRAAVLPTIAGPAVVLSMIALVAVSPPPAQSADGNRVGFKNAPLVKLGGGANLARARRLGQRGVKRADPDRDGLSSWTELHRTATNPRKFDTDGDKFGDGVEIAAGSNPLNSASTPRASTAIASPAPSPPGDSTSPSAAGPTPTSTAPPENPDTTPPETVIASGPSDTTTSTSANFEFSATKGSSTFECKLDSGTWQSCAPPQLYASLATGNHAFSVRATNGTGNTDPTPAIWSWTVQSGCTQTLDSGANLSNALSSATSGSIVCLSDGLYSFNIAQTDKSGVVVQPTAGAKPTINHSTLSGSSGFTFSNLHFADGLELLGSSHAINILDNEFTGRFGVHADGGQVSSGSAVSDVLIEGNYFHDLDFTGSEGTAGGYGMTLVNGVKQFTIRDNTIKSVAIDYIQSADPVDFTVDHNTFLGPSLRYGHPLVHQDLWQVFGGGRNLTFTNNVARNTGTNESLLIQEGTYMNVDIANNLFDHDTDGYTCQIFQVQGLIFRHNTIDGSHWGCVFRDQQPPSGSNQPGSGYEVDHNIFADTEANPDIGFEGQAASWGTYDYNVSSDGSAAGIHSVRNWQPSWGDAGTFSPLGLPFATGYQVP